MKFGKSPIKNDLVRVTTATDRQTDGQAQNNRDNVLFTSLSIGLSVDFSCGVRARVCVRESVRAFECVCVIVKML